MAQFINDRCLIRRRPFVHLHGESRERHEDVRSRRHPPLVRPCPRIATTNMCAPKHLHSSRFKVDVPISSRGPIVLQGQFLLQVIRCDPERRLSSFRAIEKFPESTRNTHQFLLTSTALDRASHPWNVCSIANPHLCESANLSQRWNISDEEESRRPERVSTMN